MTYCDKIGCPIENCIRNYTVQYGLRREPMQVDKKWQEGCGWIKEEEEEEETNGALGSDSSVDTDINVA